MKLSIVAKIITRKVEHLTNYKTMLRITDDLIFLDRLNREEFLMLLFPNSKQADGKTPSIYALNKWDLFIQDKLVFIRSCSVDKVKILVDFINECKGE